MKSPVEKLNVYRRLSDGKKVSVGALAQNKNATYFQYDDDYLKNHQSLSPFSLPFTSELSQAEKNNIGRGVITFIHCVVYWMLIFASHQWIMLT